MSYNGQSTVSFNQPSFFPGDQFDYSPTRVKPFILQSGSVPNIVASTAYTVLLGSANIAVAGNPLGSNISLAGVLVNSKDFALYGVGSNPLAATLTIPNGFNAGLAVMGVFGVVLQVVPAAVGDLVIFANATGLMRTMAPNTNIPSGYSALNATVVSFNIPSSPSAPTQAVIRITDAPTNLYTAP